LAVVQRAGRGKLTGSCAGISDRFCQLFYREPFGPAEVGPAEVGPAEVGLEEVGPAEVGPKERGRLVDLAGAALLLLGQRQKVEAGEERGKTG